MDNPAQLRIEVSKFCFFAYSSCSIYGLAHHSNKIDDHAVFSYFVYVVMIIEALSTTCPSDRLQNMVQNFLFTQKDDIFLCKHFATVVLALRTMCQSLNITMPLVLVPICGRTCGSYLSLYNIHMSLIQGSTFYSQKNISHKYYYLKKKNS
jgi:hypothetical protein